MQNNNSAKQHTQGIPNDISEKAKWSDNRVALKDVLPLEAPLCINIEASSACNFKCFYCCHSTETKKQSENMSMETFENIISGLKKFGGEGRICKTIRFAALGEPLLNKKLPEMIKMIKPYTGNVTLFTNGSLLNKNLSLSLIESGLDTLRISLQGYGAEQYKDISKVELDWDEFISNLAFINSIKGKCKIYIKMPNISPEASSKLDEFKNLCDYTILENVVPTFKNVDYSGLDTTIDKSVMGYATSNAQICPQPFFQMTVNASGSASACCKDSDEELIVGNVNSDSLYNIWNGNALGILRKSLLTGELCDVCKSCDFVKYLPPHDNIDGIRDKLLVYCFAKSWFTAENNY